MILSVLSSSIDLITVVSVSERYLGLNSTGNYEGWTSTSTLSMSWWLSLPMIAETKRLVLVGEVIYLKWASGVWMFHSLGGSFSSSTWMALKGLIFLLRLGGSNLGPQIMQELALCPILRRNLQLLFYIISHQRWYSISTATYWRSPNDIEE